MRDGAAIELQGDGTFKIGDEVVADLPTRFA